MTSPQGAFGDYLLEIYGAGLRGVLRRVPDGVRGARGQGEAGPAAFGAVLRGRRRGQRGAGEPGHDNRTGTESLI